MNATRLYGCCVLACMLAWTAPAIAQFELDGNAQQNSYAPPDDWELLYDGGMDTGGSSSAYTGIVADPGQTTIFTGGRKDIHDLTNWGWKNDGGFPDKNDITNAYAAAYVDVITNDLIIYFGADRYSNVGDAFMGFWFFKDNVTLSSGGSFNGHHQIGDILVLVNYPQGSGSSPEIQVIEWNPALQDIGSNLHLLFSGPGAICGDVPPQAACAITNATEQMSPWPYTPKSGTPGYFPPESFFEGGINITQIIGQETCFASFLAETRSSTSVTATLKDFVLGRFPVCALSTSKQCDVVGLTPAGRFVVDFGGDVTNTGAGTFPTGAEVTVVDNAGTPGDPTDDVTIVQFLTQPLAPGESQAYSGSYETDLNPASNSVDASLVFGTTTVRADPVTVQCSILVLNPDLNVSRNCELALESVGGMLVVRVDVSGEVENTGDVPLSVFVDDDRAGRVFGPELLGAGEVRQIAASYYPAAADGGETNPALASFGGTFTATGTNTVLPAPIVRIAAATCSLCPQ